jgi:hypothetical protein
MAHLEDIMKRKALLKEGDEFAVLEEGDFAAERALQEALKRNPEVIPAGDLELDEVIVVGRETPLLVGAIDLLLLDAQGRIILVETKLSTNPELRRQVIAQLLDYAASLWKTAPTLKEFESLVMRYWRSAACEDERVKSAKSLHEGVEAVFAESIGEIWDYEAFEAALEDNLKNGQYVLLVVATGLMDGALKDLLQYANICLNLPLFGVEITMFKMEGRELIVPRGVRHTAQAKRGTSSPVVHTSREAFLEACAPTAASFFGGLLEQAESRGLILYWGTKGFSVRLPYEPPVSVMFGFPPSTFQVYLRDWSAEPSAATELREKLHAVAPFKTSGRHTLTLVLDDRNVGRAATALELVWRESHGEEATAL